jgi:hypothetical protein
LVVGIANRVSQRYQVSKPPLNPRRNEGGDGKSRPNQTLNEDIELPNLKSQTFGQRSSSLSKLGQQNYEQMVQHDHMTPEKEMEVKQNMHNDQEIDEYAHQQQHLNQPDPQDYYRHTEEPHQIPQKSGNLDADASYQKVSPISPNICLSFVSIYKMGHPLKQ